MPNFKRFGFQFAIDLFLFFCFSKFEDFLICWKGEGRGGGREEGGWRDEGGGRREEREMKRIGLRI